jgi:hypothetical protein
MGAGQAGHCGDQHKRLFLIVFALTPLWFFAGLQFIIYTATALVILVLHPRPFLRPTGQEYCFFVLIAVLLVSAFKNLLEPGQDFRVLAASYNALLLLTGTLLLQQVRDSIFLDESFNTKFLSICRILFFISILLVVGASAYAGMTGATEIVFKSFFGLVTPSMRPGLLGEAQVAQLIVPDFFGGTEPSTRAVVLTTYPTAGSSVLGMLGLFTVLYYQRKGKGTAALVTLIIFVPLLILTKTRASLIGFAVGWVASGVLFGSSFQRILRILTVALICANVAFNPMVESTFHQASEYRSGSTEERVLSYRTGIEKTLSENAVIGIGIKLMDESTMTTIGIPVGSHSTFVSLFVKGGIIGFTAAVMGLVVLPLSMWIRAFFLLNGSSPLQRKLRSEAAILFNLQCLLWFWMAFDDVDAPAFATVTTFVMYGYARGWCSRHLGTAAARRQDLSRYGTA